MIERKDTETCNGRRLEFSRELHIEFSRRARKEDLVMINLLKEDCMNILNYEYEYKNISKNMFCLYFGQVTLAIHISEKKWIVVDVVHTVELK